MSATLCWKCAKACDGGKCPWVRDGTPVDGWDAIPTVIETHWLLRDSYIVKSCPLFEKDTRKHTVNTGGLHPLPEGYLSTKGLSTYWGIDEVYIRRFIAEGLPFEQDGYRRKFCIAECERWMRTSG